MDARVRATAGTGVATLLMVGSHADWPGFAPAVMEGLSSPDIRRVEGTVGAIAKGIEDAASNLLKPEIGGLVPKLIELSASAATPEVTTITVLVIIR